MAEGTINAELPKQYQFTDVEERWCRFWTEGGFYRADPNAPGDPYCIVIPPPNVTGALHAGHALDETIQDTLTRYHRMKGRNVLWLPGTDHAGIATQHVVVERLLKQGIRRTDLGREAFIEECWKWKAESGGRIVEQLKRLGCSCDWSREAFTFDAPRAHAVRVAFKKLYDKGLIYRGEYLVNWDPVSLTALSDDEVEYEEEKGNLWHLKYPIKGTDQFAVVATTRPETMLGDTAVAVNPTDERWAHLIGKMVQLPLTGREIPIIADDFVKKDFGSGMVKITPGHDPNDFLCGIRHKLPMINMMTDDAKVNQHGGKYEGLDRYVAREYVVRDLTALGLIEKIEPHVHRVGRGYRSKSVVEPRLSKQWFVKIEPLAKRAQKAVNDGEVKLIPETPWVTIYNQWMDNVRDWCISRQLWWGHRIPIWYRKDDPSRMICWDGEGNPPEVDAEPAAWHQDEDVLDTWFSSALWPLSTLGWPAITADLKKWYPTSVLVTGPDILFFWVARMIMFGYELYGAKPFHDVYMHSLIFGKSYYEKKGQEIRMIPPMQAAEMEAAGTLPKGTIIKWEKMSKSKGNVIDPTDVIEKFGTDALRMTMGAIAAQGRNIDLDWTRFEGYRNFINKFWNASRFVLMVTEPLTADQYRAGIAQEDLRTEDLWILSRLSQVIDAATKHLDSYEFDKYVGALYNFVWGDYCDWYVELVKGRAWSKATDGPEFRSTTAARTVLVTILEHVCRLLHPVTPFITEEVWQFLRERLDSAPLPGLAGLQNGFRAPSLVVAPWPATGQVSQPAIDEMATLQELIGGIRNIRGEMAVPVETKVDILVLNSDGAARARLEGQADAIRSLARVGNLSVVASAPAPKFASTYVSGAWTVLVMLPEELIARERERLQKELATLEKGLAATSAKLGNESFVGRAPADVVAKEKERLAKYEADVAAIRAKLLSIQG